MASPGSDASSTMIASTVSASTLEAPTTTPAPAPHESSTSSTTLGSAFASGEEARRALVGLPRIPEVVLQLVALSPSDGRPASGIEALVAARRLLAATEVAGVPPLSSITPQLASTLQILMPRADGSAPQVLMRESAGNSSVPRPTSAMDMLAVVETASRTHRMLVERFGDGDLMERVSETSDALGVALHWVQVLSRAVSLLEGGLHDQIVNPSPATESRKVGKLRDEAKELRDKLAQATEAHDAVQRELAKVRDEAEQQLITLNGEYEELQDDHKKLTEMYHKVGLGYQQATNAAGALRNLLGASVGPPDVATHFLSGLFPPPQCSQAALYAVLQACVTGDRSVKDRVVLVAMPQPGAVLAPVPPPRVFPGPDDSNAPTPGDSSTPADVPTPAAESSASSSEVPTTVPGPGDGAPTPSVGSGASETAGDADPTTSGGPKGSAPVDEPTPGVSHVEQESELGTLYATTSPPAGAGLADVSLSPTDSTGPAVESLLILSSTGSAAATATTGEVVSEPVPAVAPSVVSDAPTPTPMPVDDDEGFEFGGGDDADYGDDGDDDDDDDSMSGGTTHGSASTPSGRASMDEPATVTPTAGAGSGGSADSGDRRHVDRDDERKDRDDADDERDDRDDADDDDPMTGTAARSPPAPTDDLEILSAGPDGEVIVTPFASASPSTAAGASGSSSAGQVRSVPTGERLRSPQQPKRVRVDYHPPMPPIMTPGYTAKQVLLAISDSTPLLKRYTALRTCNAYESTLTVAFHFKPRGVSCRFFLCLSDLRFNGTEIMGFNRILPLLMKSGELNPTPKIADKMPIWRVFWWKILMERGRRKRFQMQTDQSNSRGYPNYIVLRSESAEVFDSYGPFGLAHYWSLLESRPWDDMWRRRVRRLYLIDPCLLDKACETWLVDCFRFMYAHRQAFWERYHWLHARQHKEVRDAAWRQLLIQRELLEAYCSAAWLRLQHSRPSSWPPGYEKLLEAEPALWFWPKHHCVWVPKVKGKTPTPDVDRHVFERQLVQLHREEPIRMQYGLEPHRFVEALSPFCQQVFLLHHYVGASWSLPTPWDDPHYVPTPLDAPTVGTPGVDFYSVSAPGSPLSVAWRAQRAAVYALAQIGSSAMVHRMSDALPVETAPRRAEVTEEEEKRSETPSAAGPSSDAGSASPTYLADLARAYKSQVTGP